MYLCEPYKEILIGSFKLLIKGTGSFRTGGNWIHFKQLNIYVWKGREFILCARHSTHEKRVVLALVSYATTTALLFY